MNLLKKITSGTIALVLATGIAGSAFAAEDDSGKASIEIVPMSDEAGVLSVSISDMNFGSLPYSLVDRDVDGTATITASDMRGTAGGWNVTLTSTDFDEGMDISNLSLSAGAVSTTSTNSDHSSAAVPAMTGVNSVVAGETFNVLTAKPGTGAGSYSAEYNTNLHVPSGTLVGEYDATITVTISGDQP